MSYKNLIGSKPLRIRFDKIDGFRIRFYGLEFMMELDV